jgi:hypothetical protein
MQWDNQSINSFAPQRTTVLDLKRIMQEGRLVEKA